MDKLKKIINTLIDWSVIVGLYLYALSIAALALFTLFIWTITAKFLMVSSFAPEGNMLYITYVIFSFIFICMRSERTGLFFLYLALLDLTNIAMIFYWIYNEIPSRLDIIIYAILFFAILYELKKVNWKEFYLSRLKLTAQRKSCIVEFFKTSAFYILLTANYIFGLVWFIRLFRQYFDMEKYLFFLLSVAFLALSLLIGIWAFTRKSSNKNKLILVLFCFIVLNIVGLHL